MSVDAVDILNDICLTLRGCGAFESVTIGPDDNAARWPRAEVILRSVDESPSVDEADGRWRTLKALVRIHVRSDEPAGAFWRVLELAQTACEALLVDRFRSQSCRDLSIGKATEFSALKVEPKVKAPYLAVAFEVRCCFESGGGQ